MKDENGKEITIIRNDSGQIIAEIHGKLNIDLIAKFFIENAKIAKWEIAKQ